MKITRCFVWFLLCFISAAIPALSSAQEPEIIFNVTAFAISGDNPLGMRAYVLLQPYLGRHQNLERLQQARQTLQNALQAAGYSFHKVVLPPQESTGVIHFQILPFLLGQLTVEGAQFFSAANIQNSLPALIPGVTPNLQVLGQTLQAANANPAKQIVVRFKEGLANDTVDARVEVQDQQPLTLLAALDNSGTTDNGRARAYFSLRHANVWNADHVLTVNAATALQAPARVKQIGLSYQAPWYRAASIVRANYSYSTVKSGALGEGLTITGSGSIAGVGVTHWLAPVGNYVSDLRLDLENKIFFGAALEDQEQTLTPDVISRPLILGYHAQYQTVHQLFEGQLEWAHNIPGGAKNNDAAYQANRLYAPAHWQVLRGSAKLVYQLPQPMLRDWLLIARVAGQYALQPLIAGEQFGIGGTTSLRGLEERAVIADTGIAASLETWSAPMLANLRVLGFIDVAALHRRMPVHQASHVTLVSTGVGLRWDLNPHTTLTADYGYVLKGVEENPDYASESARKGQQRIYLAGAYRF